MRCFQSPMAVDVIYFSESVYMQKCTPNLKLWFQTRKRAGEGACTTIHSCSNGLYKLSLLGPYTVDYTKSFYWAIQTFSIDHTKVVILTITKFFYWLYKLVLLTITNLFYWSLQNFLIIITNCSIDHYKVLLITITKFLLITFTTGKCDKEVPTAQPVRHLSRWKWYLHAQQMHPYPSQVFFSPLP